MRHVKVTEVVAYVQRLQDHGVPARVALVRAERKFGVPRQWVKSLVRS